MNRHPGYHRRQQQKANTACIDQAVNYFGFDLSAQVKAEFHAKGQTITEWARNHQFPPRKAIGENYQCADRSALQSDDIAIIRAYLLESRRRNGRSLITLNQAEQIVLATKTPSPVRIRLYSSEEFVPIRQAILSEFNGINHCELARKYLVQVQTVYSVVNQARTDGVYGQEHRNQPE